MMAQLWQKFNILSDNQLMLLQLKESPYFKKLSSEKVAELIDKAVEDGKFLAEKIKKKFPNQSLEYILKMNDMQVSYKELPVTEKFISLGVYDLPNKITINKSFLEKEKFFVETGLSELKFDNWKEAAIAHELFHYFAEREEQLFIKDYRLKLWKIGFYQHTTKLGSLEEIAAMVFTQELLQLDYYPFLLNLFLPAAFYPAEVEQRLEKLITKLSK